MNWPRPAADDSGFLARALPPLSTWMMRLTRISMAVPSRPAAVGGVDSSALGVAASATALPSGSTATPFW